LFRNINRYNPISFVLFHGACSAPAVGPFPTANNFPPASLVYSFYFINSAFQVPKLSHPSCVTSDSYSSNKCPSVFLYAHLNFYLKLLLKNDIPLQFSFKKANVANLFLSFYSAGFGSCRLMAVSFPSIVFLLPLLSFLASFSRFPLIFNPMFQEQIYRLISFKFPYTTPVIIIASLLYSLLSCIIPIYFGPSTPEYHKLMASRSLVYFS